MIKLVEALQKLRKYNLRPQPLTLAERESLVGKLLAQISATSNETLDQLSLESGLDSKALRKWELEGVVDLGLKLSRGTLENYPTGLVAIVSPKVFPLRTTLERFLPSFLAGNATLIKMSSQSKVAAQVLQDWLEKAGFPEDSFSLLTLPRQELGDFLITHPAIRGLSFVGSQSAGEKLASQGFWGKKVQMWLGGFTTNLVLDSQGLEKAKSEMLIQLQEGLWQTPLYPQRWIVLEAIEKEAETSFEETFRDQKPPFDFLEFAAREEGKVRGAWIHHLPLCSVIQQSEVRWPTATLNSVRYPFDFQKWVNHANSAFAVQIWGEVEKAEKLISKLEVGRMTINHSLNPKDSLLFGAKQSIFGTVDLNPGGLFFSESRSVRKL